MKKPPEVIPEFDEPAELGEAAEFGEAAELREAADDIAARPRRRGFPLAIVASALAGALVGGGVVFLALWTPDVPQPPEAGVTIPGAAPQASGTRVGPAGDWSRTLTAAKQLVAAGKLREAQEEYLSILLIEPTHDEAMRGLVRVVGLLARGDRAALLRQAEAYRRAVSLGIETEEHYTAPAMELLARANLQAAGARVSAATPQPAPRTTARPPARPRAEPEPAPPARTRPAPEPRPVPQRPPAQPAPEPRPALQRPGQPTPEPAPAPRPAPAPQPSPPAQPAPPPPAAVNVNEPFVTVVIGPVASSDQASAITGELTIAGYAARLRRQAAGSYVITLGPYRQSEAARAAGFVRSRFGQNVPVSLTPAP